MPSIDQATAVSGVLAKGVQNATTRAPEASAFDVWTHSVDGVAASMQAFADDPVGSIRNRAEQEARMREAMGLENWESSSAAQVGQSIAAQWDGLGAQVAAVSEAQGALATVGATFALLTGVEQLLSTMLSVIPFPAFPAIRILDMDIGLPHGHGHPPNLPPPPPVPLPSTGPIIPIPILSGATQTLINGMPAARCGDMGLGIWCGGYFPMYEVFLGSSNVWIEGARAGRILCDITKHCIFTTPKPSDFPLYTFLGTTISSSSNVMIGGVPMPSLTSLAIGAAFKGLFAGLGKAVKAVQSARRFSRLAHLKAPRGIGGIESPRSIWLGKSISMTELVERAGIPGRQGVALTDKLDDASELYSDMFKLSQQNGIEYALTRENGQFVLRSGAPDTVAIPRGVAPIAHTHPPDEILGIQPHPSRADINTLNDLWERNPDGPRPTSHIIWGPGSEHVTSFGATSIEQIPDPTKGGLKPKRRWT